MSELGALRARRHDRARAIPRMIDAAMRRAALEAEQEPRHDQQHARDVLDRAVHEAGDGSLAQHPRLTLPVGRPATLAAALAQAKRRGSFRRMRGSPRPNMRPRATRLYGAARRDTSSAKSSKRSRSLTVGLATRPWIADLRVAVELQVPRLGVAEVPLDRRAVRDLLAAGVAREQVEEDAQRLGVARRSGRCARRGSPARRSASACDAALARRDVHREREVRDVVERQADRAQPRLVGARALLEEILHRVAEARRVGRVPARRDRHAERPRQDLADDVDDRVLRLGGVGRGRGRRAASRRRRCGAARRARRCACPRGSPAAGRALQRRLDDVLAGLGERPLDDDVVERDRLGELARRAVAAQLGGHRSRRRTLAVAPGELGQRRSQAAAEPSRRRRRRPRA